MDFILSARGSFRRNPSALCGGNINQRSRIFSTWRDSGDYDGSQKVLQRSALAVLIRDSVDWRAEREEGRKSRRMGRYQRSLRSMFYSSDISNTNAEDFLSFSPL